MMKKDKDKYIVFEIIALCYVITYFIMSVTYGILYRIFIE